MRIEFPNSAREDFHWSDGLLRVGSAADNDLLLAAHQAASYHLRIVQDRRGLVLQVLPKAGRVYVNARPVRECALLRVGDVLSVGDCRMLLRDDDAPDQREPPPAGAQGRYTVSLRAVAGPLSGRVLPVTDRLQLGGQGRYPLELPQADAAGLLIAWQERQLVVEALPASVEALPASPRHPLRLNGVVVQRAVLRAGDQLGLANHRFVVDAAGLEPDPPAPAVPVEAEAAESADLSDSPRGEVWWLILTAAVLALGITAVLLIRF